MSRLLSVIFWAIIGQLVGLSWGQSCYTPGGVLSTTHFPCFPNAGTSLCCPMGWTCFSNNLCIATDSDALGSGIPVGTTIRGGCTNKAGDNDLCGDYCLNSPNDSMISCGGNSFCCGSAARDGMCNCDTKSGTFQAEGGTAQTIMGQIGLVKTATTAASSQASGSSSTRSASTTLSRSTTSATTTASISGTSQTSNNPSNTAASATSTPTDTATSSPQPFTQKIGFKVLMAIVALAIFAIIVAAIVLLLRRRRRREEDDYVPPRSNDSSMIDLTAVPPPPKGFNWREGGPYDAPRPTDSSLGGSQRVSDRIGGEREIERLPPDPEAATYRRPPPMASVPVRPYEGT